MTEALVHRGPDEDGHYRDNLVALGQRHLSIVDIAGGQQPMSNETDSLQLVCNGEIYNSPQLRRELISRGHTFKSNCDIEVILHLYQNHKESHFVELGIFERDYIDRIFQELLDSSFDYSYRLWILINLEIWYRLYFEDATIKAVQGTIDRLTTE